MVADDRPKPPRRTSAGEATGSPVSMCSRTRVARIRPRPFAQSRQSVAIACSAGYTSPATHYTKSSAAGRSAPGRTPRLRRPCAPARASARGLARGRRRRPRPGRGAPGGSRARAPRRRRWCGARRCRGRRRPASSTGSRPGRQVRPVEVDDDEVGALAGLDRSDLGLQAERARAFARRHPDHVAGRQRARAEAHRLQHGREPHLLEHVEAVVAGGAVGAERHGDAARAQSPAPARCRCRASGSSPGSAAP